MEKLFGELLVWLIRVAAFELLKQATLKVCVWLDMKIPGRGQGLL
jgi:hypothetical protein